MSLSWDPWTPELAKSLLHRSSTEQNPPVIRIFCCSPLSQEVNQHNIVISWVCFAYSLYNFQRLSIFNTRALTHPTNTYWAPTMCQHCPRYWGFNNYQKDPKSLPSWNLYSRGMRQTTHMLNDSCYRRTEDGITQAKGHGDGQGGAEWATVLKGGNRYKPCWEGNI